MVQWLTAAKSEMFKIYPLIGSPSMQQQYQITGLMISGRMYRSIRDFLLTALMITLGRPRA